MADFAGSILMSAIGRKTIPFAVGSILLGGSANDEYTTREVMNAKCLE